MSSEPIIPSSEPICDPSPSEPRPSTVIVPSTLPPSCTLPPSTVAPGYVPPRIIPHQPQLPHHHHQHRTYEAPWAHPLNRRDSNPEGLPTGPFLIGSSKPTAPCCSSLEELTTTEEKENPHQEEAKGSRKYESPHYFAVDPSQEHCLATPNSSPTPSPMNKKLKKRVSFSSLISEFLISPREESPQPRVQPANSLSEPKSLAGVFDIFRRLEQGNRPSQEDTISIGGVGNRCILFGLFDGHNGSEASIFCKENTMKLVGKHIPEAPSTKDFQHALRSGLYETDSQFLALAKEKGLDCGSTALLCCLTLSDIHVAHCGNSRAVLVIQSEHPSAKVLTQDHKASNPFEARRIELLGGHIETPSSASRPCELADMRARVQPGGYTLTRSIGDPSGKTEPFPVLTADPDVNSYKITPDMKFLVMASDGVWDVLTPTQCAAAVASCQSAREACDAIVESALEKGSLDNISVIAVRLDQRGICRAISPKQQP